MNKILKEQYIAFVVIGLVLLLGLLGMFGTDVTAFPRLLIGIGLGYTLSRGLFGFAGMANRTFRTGNANLIKGMMYLVMIVSVIIAGILVAEARIGVEIISLSNKGLNYGLFIGGALFGFGMALSSCCATGVLTDLFSSPVRALTVLVFFGIGVLFGFPYGSNEFITTPIISSIEKVSLLDIAPNDGTGGVITALIVTFIIAGFFIYLANLYEQRRGFKGKDLNIGLEEESTLFERVFVKPFNITTTILVLSVLIALVNLTRGKGWSASSVIGYWMASFLNMFGVSEEVLNTYALKTVVIEVFKDPSSLQNIGLIIGAVIATLFAGKFVSNVKQSLKTKPIELVLFALGGFLMGFGTRLSSGCNVGAFLTPATNFGLSGWIYLVVIIFFGYLGNITFKWFYKQFVK